MSTERFTDQAFVPVPDEESEEDLEYAKRMGFLARD